MKKLFSIILLLLIIFSCSKKDKQPAIVSECPPNYQSPEPIVCEGSICQSDTCKRYLSIWKELFLSKNNMTSAYFDKHITLCNVGIYKYVEEGINFELDYKVTIDWFEIKLQEAFMIWLTPNYLLKNPAVNLPGECLLSKDQINSQINNSFFSRGIQPILPLDQLIYTSLSDAMKALANAAGVKSLCTASINFSYPNTTNSEAGHPMLEAGGVINWDEDKCVSCKMDLATGVIEVRNNGCKPIDFCFIKGTKILQNIDVSKTIEKIRPGDTILSFNQKSGRTENDIVRQMDSVMHKDIVRIAFNDHTENYNTFDHPYYVKDKGWCSYKPLETLQKYNIETKQLLVGDICLKFLDHKLTEVKVSKISETPGERMTYNISRTEKNKTYFANGILVSDEK
jgi:hypothetical protein